MDLPDAPAATCVLSRRTSSRHRKGAFAPVGPSPHQTLDERPSGLAEVGAGEPDGNCCLDPDSRQEDGDVGLVPRNVASGVREAATRITSETGIRSPVSSRVTTLARERSVTSVLIWCGSHEIRRFRPVVLLLLASPFRAVFTLEVGVGSAEPLFVASTWTKVTPSRNLRDTCLHRSGGFGTTIPAVPDRGGSQPGSPSWTMVRASGVGLPAIASSDGPAWLRDR